MESEMSEDGNWTTETLLQALAKTESAETGAINVELVAGIDPAILITMSEFGDLPLLLSVSGSQILVETLLWPVEEVKDTAVFNELISLSITDFGMTIDRPALSAVSQSFRIAVYSGGIQISRFTYPFSRKRARYLD